MVMYNFICWFFSFAILISYEIDGDNHSQWRFFSSKFIFINLLMRQLLLGYSNFQKSFNGRPKSTGCRSSANFLTYPIYGKGKIAREKSELIKNLNKYE